MGTSARAACKAHRSAITNDAGPGSYNNDTIYFITPTSVRVTVGTHRDNEQFLEGLRRVITAPIRAARI